MCVYMYRNSCHRHRRLHSDRCSHYRHWNRLSRLHQDALQVYTVLKFDQSPRPNPLTRSSLKVAHVLIYFLDTYQHAKFIHDPQGVCFLRMREIAYQKCLLGSFFLRVLPTTYKQGIRTDCHAK